MNLGASLGVAVREFPLKMDSADYMLLVDRKPVGVIEAKPFGTTLSGVEIQKEKSKQSEEKKFKRKNRKENQRRLNGYVK